MCSDGIVLAVEKKANSKLVEGQGFDKICEIDAHIGCMISGLIVDSLTLVETARAEAAYHRFLYRCPINVKPLTQVVADLALNFGEGDITTKRKKIARPYGVSLTFAGIDKGGKPIMFQVATKRKITDRVILRARSSATRPKASARLKKASSRFWTSSTWKE